MASYSGHNDVFMHVRFGDAIPPRPFPSPAARAYFLSGLDKAREMVEGVRENSEGSRKATQLATRLVSALGGLRGLAEGPGYDHETLVERAEEVAEMGREARRLKKEAGGELARAIGVECVILLIFIVLLGILAFLASKLAADLSFVSKSLLLMLFFVALGIWLDIMKKQLKKIEKKMKSCGEMERAGVFISNICIFLVPQPQPHEKEEV